MRFLKSLNKKDILILLVSLIIFISPLIINYKDLPKGFELPKVLFLNITTAVTLAIFIVLNLNSIQRLKQYRTSITFIGICSLTFLLSTILSPYYNISLYGNSFRDQGLIFYILVLIGGLITYFNITKKNLNFVIISIFTSAFVQTIFATIQYLDLLNRRPALLDDGYWINGTYGQANFFSSHLVIGFIAGIYLFNKCTKEVNKKSLKFVLLFFISLFLILITLLIIASYSMFGWVMLGVTLIILLLYKLISKKIFYKVFLLTIPIALLLSYLYLLQVQENQRVDIWRASLNIFKDDSLSNPIRFLFGYGFDSLNYVFKDHGTFTDVVIDRGHNIFIDIVMQVGAIGLTLFSLIIGIFLKKLKRLSQNTLLFLLFLINFILIVKLIVHEYSAVTLYILIVLMAMLIKVINLGQPDQEKE